MKNHLPTLPAQAGLRHPPGRFLATTLATLLLSATAHADVVINPFRSVTADNGVSPPATAQSTDAGLFGAFRSANTFLDLGGSFIAGASQISQVGLQSFEATMGVSTESPENVVLNSGSVFNMLFTLTDAYSFTGFSSMDGFTTGTVGIGANLKLVHVGFGNVINLSLGDPNGGFSGLLEAGDYQLLAEVFSRTVGTGQGDTGVNLDFALSLTGIPTPPPPNNVPEPGSLALLVAGLLGLAAGRLRQA